VTHTAPVNPPLARPPFLDAFARILLDTCMCVGERMKAAPALMPLAMAVLIQARLQRLCRSFVALAEKALAGTLRPPRVRKARSAKVVDAAAGDVPKKPGGTGVLPSAPGWLLRLCPQVMNVAVQRNSVCWCRCLIERLIEENEALRTLIASDPRFARVLRPLLGMMSTDPLPAWLRLPPRPRTLRKQRDPAGRRDRSGRAGHARSPMGQSPGVRRTHADVERSWVERAVGPPPPPAAPPPAPVLPYAQIPDWTPTELTRSRPTWGRRQVTGPPLVFRSLW
jgi:hypothetical protein